MATEYIGRERASDLLEQALVEEWEPEYAQDRLSEIPAADVRPVVRAHWIETAPINKETMKPFIVKGPHLKCSNCGSIEFQRKFCPNCGADMREV